MAINELEKTNYQTLILKSSSLENQQGTHVAVSLQDSGWLGDLKVKVQGMNSNIKALSERNIPNCFDIHPKNSG